MARNYKEIQDKKGEQIVREFLIKNFYNNYNVTICEDKETQIKGIDSTFYLNNGNKIGFEYKIDEKAALDYINKEHKLSTFCLELSFLNRKDELMEGWFTNNEMENNSYLFVWIDRAKKDVLEDVNDILEAEVMLVRKDDIYAYLNNIGWNKNNLRRKCDNIRNNGDANMGDYYTNGCKFSYASYLPEKPINILLKRQVYKNMPHTIYKHYKFD